MSFAGKILHKFHQDPHKAFINNLSVANQLGNIGIVLMDMGQPKEALEHHKKALAIDEEVGNRLGVASDLGNIGIVLAALGQTEKALGFLEVSLKIFNEIGAVVHAEETGKVIAILKKEKRLKRLKIR